MNNAYLLLFRRPYLEEIKTQTEMLEEFRAWQTWFETLKAEGKARVAAPLEPTGAVVSGGSDDPIVDGPYMEAKEIFVGFFELSVSNMEEAISIARQCPALDRGVKVEVRQIFATP